MSISKSYTFTNNTIADPAEVNQNFDDLVLAIKSAHHSDADGTKLLPADIATGWGLVPSKGIIAYNDTVANIPSGYVFCNGANGTPDLRSKFIFGVDSDAGSYPLHAVGGEITHTLSLEEMPVHNHPDAGHAHTVRGTAGFSYNIKSGLDGGWATVAQQGENSTMASQTGYATSPNRGSGSAHNNMPPFHALVYIMKT